MDCSLNDALFLADERTACLPQKPLDIIRHGSNEAYLETLADIALDPRLTGAVFGCYEPLYVEICSRWVQKARISFESSLSVISALARVLPFAPHLGIYLERVFLSKYFPQNGNDECVECFQYLSTQYGHDIRTLSNSHVLSLLVAALRLLEVDNCGLALVISPSRLTPLLQHDSRPVRCVALRIFCSLMHAADATRQRLLEQYLGTEAIEGDWEGNSIDFRFLNLWEKQRLNNLSNELRQARKMRVQGNGAGNSRTISARNLSLQTVLIAGVLLPRFNDAVSGHKKTPDIQWTPTTSNNMRNIATALLGSKPVLVTGLGGCGKTFTITKLAAEVGMRDTILSLHLNEQTDAKMLIGMYTMGKEPGSLAWRPGVLTTAVKEGRWILIEDLDRAPAEVTSVLLPLIQRGELFLPNRGETIRAPRGFKVIATMRTMASSRGKEVLPISTVLGGHHWQNVRIDAPNLDEFEQIIQARYPVLQTHLRTMVSVYKALRELCRRPGFAAKSRSLLGRPLGAQDLLRWCSRVSTVLQSSEIGTESGSISDQTYDKIFLEAIDSFCAPFQDEESRSLVAMAIGEQMQIPPSRVRFYLQIYVPQQVDTEGAISIGRSVLSKAPGTSRRRLRTVSRDAPFAKTAHSLRLMEQIGAAIKMKEPVLLAGETGTGKTASIQQLADLTGFKLVAVNLSQQSESADLIGGFKPISTRSLIMPMKDEFDDLFQLTFSSDRNHRYLNTLSKSLAKENWSRVVVLWNEAIKMVEARFRSPPSSSTGVGNSYPAKKRRVGLRKDDQLRDRWESFFQHTRELEQQVSRGDKAFAFAFVEGKIVQAVRKGEWVLLDEINMASPDTLESISDLLYNGLDGDPSILLSETGEIERIKAHPNFRIFGAMNPATDIGKRDLPPGLRSRFTEIFVESPDRNADDLSQIIKVYLGDLGHADVYAAHDIAQTYFGIKLLSNENRLVDGANQKPQFSLRTLTRTLRYIVDITPIYGLRRAMYEGFSMSFLTLLDNDSEHLVTPLLDKHILGRHQNVRSLLRQIPRLPDAGWEHVQFEHYWLRKGPELVEEQPNYIITPFIRRNLLNLVRATSTRRFPVLLQGPTSSGKTSLIEYLAKLTGNKFVRINNHEHTDLQEYLGTYVSGEDGRIYFQEGVLVQALRQGYWIVLDELNLAPTDILEALNRLLDDNRELLIPETQQIVRPHSNFMLFATQNPPGLYGGRKYLSRAFRNRFLELHFDDIPENELETILRERSQIAPSFCSAIVTVYKELSILRQSNRLFEQRDSFATLRDLFRWALRDADDRNQLAVNGFMLLAERVRNPDEREAVKGVIERILKVQIDESVLYSKNCLPETALLLEQTSVPGLIWTKSLRRLFILVSQALKNSEPVLLVGETGSGKTSVCQALAKACGKSLQILNAHQNTETGDIIGAQRPIRDRTVIGTELVKDLRTALAGRLDVDIDISLEAAMGVYDQMGSGQLGELPSELRERIQKNKSRYRSLFEWSDGILVSAMKRGQFFLLDEISLADDSVLERLNSVLEPSRSLLLAEKGPDESNVVATEGFQFLATMNPGGDYGKRELSPALRNRFTEIWVPPLVDVEELLEIVATNLVLAAKKFADPIVKFTHKFASTFTVNPNPSLSIRNALAWVNFINHQNAPESTIAFLHGAAMVYIDSLGANPAAMVSPGLVNLEESREQYLSYLGTLLQVDASSIYWRDFEVVDELDVLKIGDFTIQKFERFIEHSSYILQAPTTKQNALRIVRAMQLPKPILIEGSPGVGKTTLVSALAQTIGQPLTRINLSEQTDLMDLFGSDVPIEGNGPGNFAWRDAPFLRALKHGHWVLLDEMNLASQSVLEGLNACLDHRGEAYIAELDRLFYRHPNFRIFAAQNPHHQGGGRKGLPASFVNRFTVVYADLFKHEDLLLICSQSFPDMPETELTKILNLISNIDKEVVQQHRFGMLGGPWEFNLRDILRVLQLSSSQENLLAAGDFQAYFDLIVTHRFRSSQDKDKIRRIFDRFFNLQPAGRRQFHNLSPGTLQVGLAILERDQMLQYMPQPILTLSDRELAILEATMICVLQNWPCLLVGPSGSGKSSTIKAIASLIGVELVEFPLNSDMDTMDLVGGYEQVDSQRRAASFFGEMARVVRRCVLRSNLSEPSLSRLILCLSYSSKTGWEREDIEETLSNLVELSKDFPSDPSIKNLIRNCDRLLQSYGHQDKPSFEWVDGILVQALERGAWLVLDHANLCNSSVLDRINSLLEPNGVLIMNEHRNENGEAKMIRPHQNFRLFLTMDPKHGELSRAMRNRTVEIYLPHHDFHPDTSNTGSLRLSSESSLYRFSAVQDIFQSSSSNENMSLMMESALNHLSVADTTQLESWQRQINIGLLNLTDAERQSFSAGVDRHRGLIHSQSDLRKALWHESLKESTLLGSNDFIRSQVAWITQTNLSSLWWFTFELVQSPGYSDGTFQAHLSIWEAFARGLRTENTLIGSVSRSIEKGLHSFHSVGRLSTGLSMEILWPVFRSKTVSDEIEALHMGDIASRLDGILWSRGFPIDRRIPLQDSVAGVLAQVVAGGVDTETSLKDIREAVDIVERVNTDNELLTPIFESEFEGLCQYFDILRWQHGYLQYTGEIDRKALLFSKRPTKWACAKGASISPSSRLLLDLSLYAGLERGPESSFVALKGTLVSSIAEKLRDLSDASLQQVEMLQDELRTLGSVLASSTEEVARNQLRAISNCLVTLISEVFRAHRGYMTDHYFEYLQAELFSALPFRENESLSPKAGLKWLNNISDSFPRIFDDYLLPAIKALRVAAGLDFYESAPVANSWLLASTGFLLLFVPDKEFDPSLKPFVQRSWYTRQRKLLLDKIGAVNQFEASFAGHSSNLRSEVYEELLKSLGEEPPVAEVRRPETARLSQLQVEFSNIVQAIIRPLQDSIIQEGTVRLGENSMQDLKLLQQNIFQSRQRLKSGYEGYEDITLPTDGFLNCLNIGVALLVFGESDRSSKISSNTLRLQIPFLGATPQSLILDLPGPEDLVSEHGITKLRYLEWLSVYKSDQSTSSLRDTQEERLQQVCNILYTEWKSRLGAQQKDEAARSSLYRYRAGAQESEEQEEKEFNALFPDYEQHEVSTSSFQDKEESPRSTAIQLYNLHSLFFAESTHSTGNFLTSIMKSAMKKEATVFISDQLSPQGDQLKRLLPGILLSLHEAQRALQESAKTTHYNFYSDPNVLEAHKVAVLIDKVRKRFKHIQQQWPEHATLQDVLNVCKELLDFRHVEPIAKYLSKLEKLHEHVHQWQLVASKELSVADLRDDITALVIDWRRLELSTWPRLLELEEERCKDDAKSWWFIGYESVVELALSISESSSVQTLSIDFLSTLQKFFDLTSLGQFSQRLRLLEQLKFHLATIQKHQATVAPIYESLANFLDHCLRYEPKISDTITKGRQTLEKDIKDVVLLASWKDTNITALRQSAKRSHNKLFRLVRKFREILGRPVSEIFSRSLPEIKTSFEKPRASSVEHPASEGDSKALETCQLQVPEWSKRPSHLTDISGVVARIRSIAHSTSTKFGEVSHAQDFTSNLTTSMKELQKSTPSSLTKENKEKVKYLNSRKRKLFADTLKEIKNMGFKANVSVQTLERQGSLSAVLSNLRLFPPQTSLPGLAIADDRFHRILSLFPQARLAARDYSQDLNASEVSRSVGYLESMMSFLIKQRTKTASIASDLCELSHIVKLLSELWQPNSYTLRTLDKSQQNTSGKMKQCLSWLPIILEIGSRMLEVHQSLSSFESSSTISWLTGRTERFQTLSVECGSLPCMRGNASTSKHEEFQAILETELQDTRSELHELLRCTPRIAYIIEQIIPWTILEAYGATATTRAEWSESNLDEPLKAAHLDAETSVLVNSILVSLQGLQRIEYTFSATSDDPAWLAKEDSALRTALNSLHASEITGLMKETFEKTVYLGDEQMLITMAALFRTILPIVNQFTAIYSDLAQRYVNFHGACCEMTEVLLTSFTQLASQGFCSPTEQGDENENKGEKVEEGTGLGEGSGAEDISKDVGDDEDLSELAQEPGESKDQEDIEDEKNAKDIEDELEGKMGDVSEEGDDDAEERGSEDDGDEMDEEAGEVDDLDPTAVDEKMWDGDAGKENKEQENQKAKGQPDESERNAAQADAPGPEDEDESDDSPGDDDMNANESETVDKETEPTNAEPPEGENLQLPDEMDLTGDKNSNGDDDDFQEDLDEMSSVSSEQTQNDNVNDDAGEEPPEVDDRNTIMEDEQSDDESQQNGDNKATDSEKQEPELDQTMDDESEPREDNMNDDHTNGDPTEEAVAAPASSGEGGDEQEELQVREKDENQSFSQTKQSDGQEDGKDVEENLDREQPAANEMSESMPDNQARSAREQDNDPQEQAFKKLGDALQQWHRQRGQIQKASDQQTQHAQDEGVANDQVEFEHLLNDDIKEDTQAMGAATEEQIRALDDNMALDDDLAQNFNDGSEDEDETKKIDEDVEMGYEPSNTEQQPQTDKTRAGAIVGARQSPGSHDGDSPGAHQEGDEDMSDVDTHMSTIDLNSFSGLQDAQNERNVHQLWAHYEYLTRSLSLSLTEQLRLILAPTLATKMRGDFRTGKRLNIKRIIPYIASQYKRDKIWMRRSVPTKRAYQIMLAVDDSKSMAENDAGDLAFQTLVMVARSLASLEVGQICVVAFGENFKIAHDFNQPFSNDAGASMLKDFSFQQRKTDVKKLLEESLNVFETARTNPTTSGGAAELWQLQLIISDGLCEDHDIIRRLVRQAHEQRIMIVFVIVDNIRGSRTDQSNEPNAKGKSAPSGSIMDMTQAKFHNDGKGGLAVKMHRYLDGFPFPYYLIVGDVRDLPQVLAMALRQWFSEVTGATE
ncbi:MAG: hypothetical protein M4579_000527 [Chaenotheca gracillima]|nr:MAG: hypothetical protein M4579_000527 [Chaenotheca gracillima]